MLVLAPFVLMNQKFSSASIHAGSLVMLAFSLAACGDKKSAAPSAPPPPAVIVAEVTQADVPMTVENVAQTEAAQTVEIRARVQGFLIQAPFQEGGNVKKGALLFQIDPKPFQATVDQARSSVTKAEATLERAKADAKRLEPLVQQKAISQQELDNANLTVKVSEADLLSVKAQLTTAELNLSYTEMRAPFDGMIGARMVDVGNYVGSSTDTMLLATISTTNPIRAVFNVAEGNFLRFQRRFMGDEAAREKHSAEMKFELILTDGSVYEHNGKFEFADRALDARAGTLKIVVSFPNEEALLRPGQFGRVRATPEMIKGAVLVPQRAIATTQSAQMVYVVGEGNKVEQRPVKAGYSYEGKYVVDSGVKPGEKVVLEGLQKIRPGMIVNPMPESTQAPEPTSTPLALPKPSPTNSTPAAAPAAAPASPAK